MFRSIVFDQQNHIGKVPYHCFCQHNHDMKALYNHPSTLNCIRSNTIMLMIKYKNNYSIAVCINYTLFYVNHSVIYFTFNEAL